MTPTPTGTSSRRVEVRRHLATGDVASLRDLAGRLQHDGIDVTPEVLRADVRALGVIRVEHGDATALALPVEGGGAPADRGTAARLAAEVSADPDWPIQVGVAAVVGVFLLVALAGWLIS